MSVRKIALESTPRRKLIALVREMDAKVKGLRSKSNLVEGLLESKACTLQVILERFSLGELIEFCRDLGLEVTPPDREDLVRKILAAEKEGRGRTKEAKRRWLQKKRAEKGRGKKLRRGGRGRRHSVKATAGWSDEAVDWLVKKRKAQGLVQWKLGELIGVSQGMVSAWETGRSIPSVEAQDRIRELFGDWRAESGLPVDAVGMPAVTQQGPPQGA